MNKAVEIKQAYIMKEGVLIPLSQGILTMHKGKKEEVNSLQKKQERNKKKSDEEIPSKKGGSV